MSLWPLVTARRAPPARSLLAESPRYGPPSAAVIRWPNKLIVNLDSENARLFDLAADPGEQTDLGARRTATVATLRGELDRHLRTAARPRPQAATLDDATRERLRALGYLE
jgi:hypothetical protein